MAIISSSVNVLIISSEDDQYKKTPPFQVVFFYIVFGPPVRTREESVFDKEAWRDGSIAV